MRYYQELEDLLRISQEYDNNTKTIHDMLLNLIGRETGKIMTLHHLAINLHNWLLYAEVGMRLLSLFLTVAKLARLIQKYVRNLQ